MQKATHHVVIARYKEDLQWVRKLPEHFEIFLYNKGPEIDGSMFAERKVHIIPRPNVGRESETNAYHMLTHYDKSADWTWFLQGNPFDQAPHVFDLLVKPPPFPLFVPLTNQWLSHDDVPPEHTLQEYTRRTGKMYRLERMSTHTIVSVLFHDQRGYNIGRNYLHMYRLPLGTNIMQFFFSRLGLDNWLPREAEIINMVWGAMFGVTREGITQHPRSVYQRIVEESTAHEINGYLIERCWCALFDRALAQTYEP